MRTIDTLDVLMNQANIEPTVKEDYYFTKDVMLTYWKDKESRLSSEIKVIEGKL